MMVSEVSASQRWSGAGVPEWTPQEFAFCAGAGAGVVIVGSSRSRSRSTIKVCAGANQNFKGPNICNVACQTDWN